MSEITVIVNFFKEKEFQVRRAMDSLVNQSYQAFDTIVIIDGDDKNNIGKIIDEYKVKLNNLQCHILENSNGIAYSRNFGIYIASTTYLSFLDGDDEYLANKLQLQIDFLKSHPNLDVLGCWIIPVDEANHNKYFYEKFEQKVTEIKHKVPVHNPTILLKKEIFDNYGYFDSRMKSSEDFELFIRWFQKGVKFANLSEFLYKYYRDTSGVNANLNYNLRTAFKLKLKKSIELNYTIFDYIRLFIFDGFLCLLPRYVLKHIYFVVNIYILGKSNAN